MSVCLPKSRFIDQQVSFIVLPYVFEPLPLGSIKPQGWLRDQLELMADGLPGHMHDFYHLVHDAPWVGGQSEYSPLNEAFPYWFNGLVPLAYSADDDRLKKEVRRIVERIVADQQEDGWIGPETSVERRNFWGRYPLFLGLTQLVEAEPSLAQGNKSVIASMHRFVDLMHGMLSNDYQGFVWHPGDDFDEQWGRSRAADMAMALQWLLEKYPQENERKLWDCMVFLYEMAYDWSYWFSEDVFIKTDLDMNPIELTSSLFPFVHNVNAGQGLKAGAVWRRLGMVAESNQADKLLESSRRGVNWTFEYHGAPSGAIIGDERLAGLSPVRGVELCGVVETMFSLSYLYQTIGDKDFADKSELAAYNAMPAMITPKWWAHQYIAQTNQPISHELTRSPFWNVGNWGQTFGLEPNYPCCTVNFPQGYPKFLSASFVRDDKYGFAHALLGPAIATTTTISGARVMIDCETNYPFSNTLYYKIEAEEGFYFSVRVPQWAVMDQTTISVNGAPPRPVRPDASTGMHRVYVEKGKSAIVYQIGAEVRIEPRANDTISIYHGALLYSTVIHYNATKELPHHDNCPEGSFDWELTPTQPPWNVAIDPSTLRFSSSPDRNAKQLPNPIWDDGAPPVSISAMACELEWELLDGYAPNPPLKHQRRCTGPSFEIELTPYGAAKLHMAELPTVDLHHNSGGGGHTIDQAPLHG